MLIWAIILKSVKLYYRFTYLVSFLLIFQHYGSGFYLLPNILIMFSSIEFEFILVMVSYFYIISFFNTAIMCLIT